MPSKLEPLLKQVRACRICEQHLPLGPRPVLQLGAKARILIAGQAPGRKVHQSGKPFEDVSGKRLREWIGISENTFYDADQVAILPMGFCFPGTGKSGDLPPRPECSLTWRLQLLEQMPKIKMTLVIGQYAQAYHFSDFKGSLTDLVKSWQGYWPELVPLPHPSPRNNRWLKQNPWFESNLLPVLQDRVREIIPVT